MLFTRIAPICLLALLAFASVDTRSSERDLWNVKQNFNESQGALGVIDSSHVYGITEFGGNNNIGSIFAVSRDTDGSWGYKVIHDFSGSDDGAFPESGPIAGPDGSLYGTTGSSLFAGGGVVYKLTPDGPHGEKGWHYTILYTFPSTWFPGPIAWGPDGNLYGATLWNGSSSTFGAIYQINPREHRNYLSIKPLYIFQNGSDGAYPTSPNPDARGLVLDKAGNIYGTTYIGGPLGGGTIFKLSPPPAGGGIWTITNLHNFPSRVSSHWFPFGDLLLDAEGNIYGIFAAYGADAQGEVYKLTRKGEYQVLFSFDGNGSKGLTPEGGLVWGPGGTLLGTTANGGDMSCGYFGCGLVYQLTPPSPASETQPWTETVLHTFNACPYWGPSGSLAPANNGEFFGVTQGSGDEGCIVGLGEIFSVTPDGAGKK